MHAAHAYAIRLLIPPTQCPRKPNTNTATSTTLVHLFYLSQNSYIRSTIHTTHDAFIEGACALREVCIYTLESILPTHAPYILYLTAKRALAYYAQSSTPPPAHGGQIRADKDARQGRRAGRRSGSATTTMRRAPVCVRACVRAVGARLLFPKLRASDIKYYKGINISPKPK